MSWSSTATADGASSLWMLSEPSGTMTDSVGAFAGTVTDSPLRQQTAIISEGASVVFDGFTSQYIDMGNHYGAGGTASFSAEFWYLPTTIDGSSRYPLNKQSTTDGWAFNVSNASNGNITFRRRRASVNVDTSSSFTPTAGTTYHIVGTYDGTNSRLYVNASLAATGAADTTAITDGVDNFRVGGHSGGGGRPAGPMQGVAFYNNIVLTLTQVQAHYTAGVLAARNLLFNRASSLRVSV